MGGVNRRIYPKANTTAQWWETAFSRSTFSRIDKILLHTTETTGWPGYKSGASAPTLTYHCRQRAWRQHNFLDRSARALVDPDWTPVRENRDNVIQIEIIAYADEGMGKSVGGLPVSQLTDDNLKDLGEFIGWVNQQWGGPPLVAARFIPYPGSYGNSSVRMSSSTYDAFRGVLGHQHASGNAHGDPGALNVPRIMQHAAAYVGGSTITPTEEDDMQLTDTVNLITDKGVDYSAGTTTVEGILASTNFYLLYMRNQVNTALAAQKLRDEAILAAVSGLDTAAILARIDEKADVNEAELAVELAGPLAEAITAKLPTGALTQADVEQAVRSVLGSVDNV